MGIQVEIKDLAAQPIAFIKVTTKADQLGAVMHDTIPAVWAHLEGKQAHPAGAPFTRYLEWSQDHALIQSGFPVAAPVAGEGRVESGELPAGKVASTIHVGGYDKLEDTYIALEAWIKESGHEGVGAPWEFYLTDPGANPDTSTWQTEICWPIK